MYFFKTPKEIDHGLHHVHCNSSLTRALVEDTHMQLLLQDAHVHKMLIFLQLTFRYNVTLLNQQTDGHTKHTQMDTAEKVSLVSVDQLVKRQFQYYGNLQLSVLQ